VYQTAAHSGAIFNVRDYGAIGNGRADDTGAIARALAGAVRHGRGTVFFPAGTYAIVPAQGPFFVASDVTFAGVGRDSVIRVADNAGPYNFIFGQHPGRVRNVAFRDLRFDQNPTGNGKPGITFTTNIQNVIQLYSFDHLTVDGVDFDPEPGIQAIVAAGADHPSGLAITHCVFRFVRERSAYANYDESTVYIESQHGRISDNVFLSTDAQNAITAIEVHGGPDIAVEKNRIVQFEVGMNLANSTKGYPDVPATQFTVRTNDFRDVAIGIDFWSVTGRTFRNTTVADNAFSFAQHRLYRDTWLGIEFQPGGASQGLGGNFDGITVVGNQFDFSRLQRQRIATSLSAAFHLDPDSIIRRFTARDNVMLDPPAAAIEIGEAASASRTINVSFERNRIEGAGWDPKAPRGTRAAVILGSSVMDGVHVDQTTIVAPDRPRGVFSFIAEPASGSRNVTLNYDRVIPPGVLRHRISSVVQTKGTRF
jgi:hypothetical protein